MKEIIEFVWNAPPELVIFGGAAILGAIILAVNFARSEW